MTDLEFVAVCEKCKLEKAIKFFDHNLQYCDNCNLEKLFSHMKIDDHKYILSIDIGIRHLGMSLACVNDDYDILEIVWVNMLDITIFDCLPDCKLFHGRNGADWVAHIVHKYYDIFEKASIILIERQPPDGQVHIEQLLFAVMREKSVLIHPRSVHCHFHMGDFDYETRKKYSIRVGMKYVKEETLQKFERSHDITDSILFTIYWCSIQKKELEKVELKRRREEAFKKYNQGLGMSIDDFFNMYRYVPH